METPFFGEWRAWFSRRARQIRSLPPDQLEPLFEALLPCGLLDQSGQGSNSRRRLFTLRRSAK